MKIALFSYFYFPRINGVVTGMENLRKGLVESGHEVYIFAPKSKKYAYPPEVKIIDFPSINIETKDFFFPLPITFSTRIFKKFKEFNFDIIHTQHPFYVGESAHFYAKRFKIPLIFTFWTQYDQYTLSYFPFLPKKTTVRAINKYLKDFVSRCDGVIIPNKEIVKNKYLQNTRTRNEVINFGVDVKKFQGEAEVTREKLGIKPEQTVLLTLSRIAKEKNIDFLIKVFAQIQKENDRTVFFIVGDGPGKKDLEKLVKKMRLASKVIFTGEIPYQNISDYYKIADIFLYSCLTDVQPQSLVEAVAAGLPVVAINSPDRRYLIRHNKNGLLVANSVSEFAKITLNLIKNSRQRKSLSQNALKTARKFSYQNSTQKVVKFYRQVIKSYR